MYDLSADPYETFNLIDDAPTEPVVMEYRSALQRWMQETSDPLLATFETETDAANC